MQPLTRLGQPPPHRLPASCPMPKNSQRKGPISPARNPVMAPHCPQVTCKPPCLLRRPSPPPLSGLTCHPSPPGNGMHHAGSHPMPAPRSFFCLRPLLPFLQWEDGCFPLETQPRELFLGRLSCTTSPSVRHSLAVVWTTAQFLPSMRITHPCLLPCDCCSSH